MAFSLILQRQVLYVASHEGIDSLCDWPVLEEKKHGEACGKEISGTKGKGIKYLRVQNLIPRRKGKGQTVAKFSYFWIFCI